MAITQTAPFAPTAAVTKVLDTYRDTGLGGGPITTDVLKRMSMGDEIARRVASTLRALDLIDQEGRPTESLTAFKQAATADYKQVFADLLYDQYAPVFAVLGKNIAIKTSAEVEDAFRTYKPDSLRKRMVTLFLGLCEYAGIIDKAPARKPGPKQGAPRKPAEQKKKDQEQRLPPSAPEPKANTARDRYADFLLEKAKTQENPDPELLDRIERALGIGGDTS